ncbi:hypothetical protein [Halogranum rubrum]|uniref:hypothetical protein n=1 Tax=Halogranum rubrum TaxID=553466 RepID=UPI0012F7648E|nr:hypothetical protein [Halogranum salarium]
MDRRSLLSLVAGVAIGWTGATLVDDDSSNDDSGDAGGSGGAGDGTGSPSPTDAPPATGTPTPTPEPAETQTATAEPTATPEPTPTETATPESNPELQRNLDINSRGFGDDETYQVLYSIRNENDVAVSVTFVATVQLQNGTELREKRTATIDPGQAATDELVFDEYESSPSGYGFRPTRTVEA